MQVVGRLISLISEHGTDQLAPGEALITHYQRRLAFMRQQTMPQLCSANAGLAVSEFMLTMQGLQEALEHPSPEHQTLTQAIEKAITDAKSATTRLRTLQVRIGDLEPKYTALAEMMTSRIEKASATADQLPTDLKTLKEVRKTIEKLLADVILDREKVVKQSDNVP